SFTNASVTGSTVYIRTGQSGGFTVTASSSDADSGVAGYSFPSLGSGWNGSQAGAAETYTFDSSATPSGSRDVPAQNGAGQSSAAGSFSIVGDTAAPVTSVGCGGGACSAGWYSSPVSVSLSATDAA